MLEVELLRIAPRADAAKVQSKLADYCRLAGLAGMTVTHASIAAVARLRAKVLRFLRTEFWWAN